MSRNQFRNNFKIIASIFFLLSIVLSLVAPIIFINSINFPHITNDDIDNYDTHPEPNNLNQQGFSKDNYSEILTNQWQSYGSITASNVEYHQSGLLSLPSEYPNLDYDLNSKYLDVHYEGSHFIKSTSNAQFDNLDETIVKSNVITVEVRDVLSVRYYNASLNLEGYFIYGLRLVPTAITQIRVQNVTDPIENNPIETLSSQDYLIDTNGFMVFDFIDYYESDALNFTTYISWHYNLSIFQWGLNQDFEDYIPIREKEQNFSAIFKYDFNIIGYKFQGSNLLFAGDFRALLKLNLPNRDLLFNHSLKVNNQSAPFSIISDNSVEVWTTVDNSTLNLRFLANYSIKFENPVYKSWAIDRLIEGKNTRERIYFPSLIAGPDRIFVANLIFFENDITYDQVLSISSLFQRPQVYAELNRSLYEAREANSLIFTEKVIRRLGLNITIPYLIKGETCPFIIKYQTDENLRVILTDSIYMPLQGHRIEVYYYGKQYGTYISNDQVQPIAPVATNEAGEILLEHVPNGNYSLRIYLFDILLTETYANPENQINYITTNIIHFPVMIIIYFLINSAFITTGFFIYRKNKKKR